MQNVAVLSPFITLVGSSQTLDGEWRIAPAHTGCGLRTSYAELDFDDSQWESVQLPHLRHSTVDQDTLLVRRVYQKGSLRHTDDGFTFALRNPAMPALIERLSELRVDYGTDWCEEKKPGAEAAGLNAQSPDGLIPLPNRPQAFVD